MIPDLAGKRILLGVCGSIAAYKAADICSALSKAGAEVHVVLTPHAARFVGPPVFRALSRNPVLVDLFDEPHAGRIAHIDLAQSADLVLVAPASANILAKLAHGLADDMLSTCLLAVPPTTPLLVAPAMNTVMWEHPATVANLTILRARGVQFVEPASGVLACLDVGPGKLAAVDDILAAATVRLVPQRDLEGLSIVVTAGATREPLDPVRFLTNRSSGRMGFAIARMAADRGAHVTLITAHASIAPPAGVEVVRVDTAAEMLTASLSLAGAFDIFIAAAAVADYTPETVAPNKIKRAASSHAVAGDPTSSTRGIDGAAPSRIGAPGASIQEPAPHVDREDAPPGAQRTPVRHAATAATNFESENGPPDASGAAADDCALTLRLRPTRDIVAAIGAAKRAGQTVVAFAAETERLVENARRKLASKRADLVVANDVTAEGAGFDVDTNVVTLVTHDRDEALPLMSKREVAARLLDEVVRLRGGPPAPPPTGRRR